MSGLLFRLLFNGNRASAWVLNQVGRESHPQPRGRLGSSAQSPPDRPAAPLSRI
jgi:hypothetical protein